MFILKKITLVYLFVFIVSILSGCAFVGGVYNPENLSKSDLAQISEVAGWPHHYRIVSVNGVEAKSANNPFVSDAFTRIEPGVHTVRWLGLSLGEHFDSGILKVTLEAGKVYSLGKKNKSSEVAVWEKVTGEIVSENLSN